MAAAGKRGSCVNPPYAVGSVETGLEIYKYTIYNIIYTAGKISIEHVTIFLSKNISKGAIDMKFSPDVGNNPSNPYIQRKQIK